MPVRGFFSKELSTEKGRPKKLNLERTVLATEDCAGCGLDKYALSPHMEPTGENLLNILLLGMVPGRQEDEQNKQFVGETRDVLRLIEKKFGYDIDRDFTKHNCVNCRTQTNGANRDPSRDEFIMCRPFYRRTIQGHQGVIVFGELALGSYLIDKTRPITKDVSMSRWRGFRFPDIEYGIWVYPINHPSAINYSKNAFTGKSELEPIFTRDFHNAVKGIQNSDHPRIENWPDRVTCITSYDEIMALLRSTAENPPRYMAYDYEATALKPIWPESEIVSISFAYGETFDERAFSFPVNHAEVDWSKDRVAALKQAWKRVIGIPRIQKIAQNIQMEERWNRKYLNIEDPAWFWDTMQAAHILDERPKTCNLDFQVFIHWGYEYAEAIDQYKSSRKKPDPINRMRVAPLDKLLLYGGLDSLFTFMLQEEQQKEMEHEGDEFFEAFDFWMEGVESFCDLEDTGMVVDLPYYKKAENDLSEQIQELNKELRASEEVKIFRERMAKPMNFNSDGDMQTLIYDLLKVPKKKLTPSGLGALDEETLMEIADNEKIPFIPTMLRKKKLDKALGTYLKNYINFVVSVGDEYRLYPDFNLHLTRSLRSSSSSPNFQNIPKHDPEIAKILRSGFIPPKGFKLAEVDFGSQEMRIIGCVFKDPVMLDELNSGEKFDPHGEWCRYMGLDKIKPFKEARQASKNDFIFPTVYGALPVGIQTNLYQDGFHLDLTEVKRAQEAFFDKYKVLRANQLAMRKEYDETGYLHFVTGFRRGGLLDNRKIFNTPVQGPAFHCLLLALNKIRKVRRAQSWTTQIAGQIHDSIFMYIWPPEEKMIIKTITDIMENQLHQEWPWLIVPLACEWDIGPIDGDWTQVKTIDNMDEYLKML